MCERGTQIAVAPLSSSTPSRRGHRKNGRYGVNAQGRLPPFFSRGLGRGRLLPEGISSAANGDSQANDSDPIVARLITGYVGIPVAASGGRRVG